ncbi:hypothetical protein H6P81_008775 [Aristolochia fimbriata]|uniref:Uncharacterized protein n=1 Tax=Aristolochia fimbriata TaxID=158543 RepID=A0AAV7EL54_ARIFI|nr:hypothetical protein H6P81_008775 [Aristolochia fimbriata]
MEKKGNMGLLSAGGSKFATVLLLIACLVPKLAESRVQLLLHHPSPGSSILELQRYGRELLGSRSFEISNPPPAVRLMLQIANGVEERANSFQPQKVKPGENGTGKGSYKTSSPPPGQGVKESSGGNDVRMSFLAHCSQKHASDQHPGFKYI